MSKSPLCRLFIGSSSEGLEVARALQVELLDDFDVQFWKQGMFEPGGYALDSLIEEAKRCDFAVLVATPDDIRESRRESAEVPRDNVILEFGLFVGVLGRIRTLVLATSKGVAMPSDMFGLTQLSYHDQSNPRAAVAKAVYELREHMVKYGRRPASERAIPTSGSGALQAELDKLIHDATSQGWSAKNTITTLRLTSPKGRTFTLTKTKPETTREQLRPFVAKLRSGGLRVSDALRRPPEESPFA